MQIPETESSETNESLLAICLFAAFSDGEKSESERETLQRLSEELGSEDANAIARQILMGKLKLQTVVSALPDQQQRLLAYEMARSVCEAGGSISPDEETFLTELRGLLALNAAEIRVVDNEVDAISKFAIVPGADIPPPTDLDAMILKYSILNGALELLPETLATMAIVPMQMKLVHGIGKAHGVELNRSNIKEFLATAGIGLGSQIVEGFARKFMKGLGKKLGGGLGGSAASQVTGSAFSFASTYAIGQTAVKYYAGGRKLTAADMKSMIEPLTRQAREIHSKYLPDIQERAKSLNPSSILSMIKGNAAV